MCPLATDSGNGASVFVTVLKTVRDIVTTNIHCYIKRFQCHTALIYKPLAVIRHGLLIIMSQKYDKKGQKLFFLLHFLIRLRHTEGERVHTSKNRWREILL